ncbi:MAG: ABC transporter permease [Bryobacteraceae bacterium]|jgi:ABC-2 type transport system permease protein
MHRILLIAKRDYLATIRTKAFIIGLVVAPILFGGGFLGLALMQSKPDIRERRIAIIDRTGVMADAVIQAALESNAKGLMNKKTGRQLQPRYVFEIAAPAADAKQQRLALSDRVRHEQLFAFIEINPTVLDPAKDSTGDEDDKDTPAAKDPAFSQVATFSNAGGFDDVGRWLSSSVGEGVRRVRLAKLGVDSSRNKEILDSLNLGRFGLVSRDEKTGEIREAAKKNEAAEFGIPFGLMLLLGMIVMVGSSPMLSAVTEDKAQRLVEMLLGLATPFELMMGKVLGALGVSLTSSAFYIIGGTLALEGMGMSGLVPFGLFPWFYAYLVADVLFLCSLAAALGSGCNSPQEAQQLAVLLLAPVMIPYFLLTFVIQQPNGAISTAMSLFPPFTPMLMLLRQALPGGVPAWQPWVGLAGVLIFTLLMVGAAARIFRVAILLQGKAPKVAELVRWAVKG